AEISRLQSIALVHMETCRAQVAKPRCVLTRPANEEKSHGDKHRSLSGYKGVLAARLKHHVCPPPRLIVDQAPFVALADMVDGDQHVSGTQHESLTVGSREFECPRERNHKLRLRVRVPIVRRVCWRLLEMDGDHIGASVLIYSAFDYM